MAFMGILPEAPSFGTQLARGLGAGLGQGVSQGTQLAQQMAMEQAKEKRRLNLVQDLLGKNDSLQIGQSSSQQAISEVPTEEQIAALSLYEPELAKVLESQRKQRSKESFARETAAEPKLQEMEDKLSSFEESEIRFDRLNELFKPELESKFPPAFGVGLMTKEGELRPTAAALLSPEAQESVKLVADELKGAKKTFGARVTNFDLQAYMKRLPTLLNTPEGRRRVLRDIRLLNKLNRTETEGVLEVIDRYGGPGKISVSKAQRIFHKEFAPKKKQFAQEFAHPEKAEFSEIPDASIYAGRTLEDPETGQRFKSDGKNWIPQ